MRDRLFRENSSKCTEVSHSSRCYKSNPGQFRAAETWVPTTLYWQLNSCFSWFILCYDSNSPHWRQVKWSPKKPWLPKYCLGNFLYFWTLSLFYLMNSVTQYQWLQCSGRAKFTANKFQITMLCFPWPYFISITTFFIFLLLPLLNSVLLFFVKIYITNCFKYFLEQSRRI